MVPRGGGDNNQHKIGQLPVSFLHIMAVCFNLDCGYYSVLTARTHAGFRHPESMIRQLETIDGWIPDVKKPEVVACWSE